MRPSPQDLIELFQLKPHPEGGYYSEVYRSDEMVPKTALPKRYGGDRAFGTAIYFLLTQGSRSRLHRLRSDELWHFYLGDPVWVFTIDSKGNVDQVTLGQDVFAGHRLFCKVERGLYFGAIPKSGSEFSLVGCTVAPGFAFADFELADRHKLLAQFPHARSLIEQLT